MKSQSISLNSSARIHFGLFSVGSNNSQRFGGMGLMVKSPGTSIVCHSNDELQFGGLNTELLSSIVDDWFDRFGHLSKFDSASEIPFRIEIHDCPPRHSGFGSGTQIALGVSTVLFNALRIPTPSAGEIAKALNRGRRSAIGSYGFFRGGFLVDRGISDSDLIAPLDFRVDFPDEWSVVLIQPIENHGLHGSLENEAFTNLVTQSTGKRQTLIDLCKDSIVPAIVASDYKRLGVPLCEFNRLSGEYFSEHQFGCYHSKLCSDIVDQIRQFGIDAVGQSSWGPCIFAIAHSDRHANDLMKHLRTIRPDIYSPEHVRFVVTKADNVGARIDKTDRIMQTYR